MEQDIAIDEAMEARHKLVWWLYLLHGASLFFSLGLFTVIPLIVNYLKHEETADTYLYSHHSWQIRSFWWYVLWVAVGWFLVLSLFGIPLAILVFAAAFIWKAYRLVRGFLDLQSHRSMPMPPVPAEGPR